MFRLITVLQDLALFFRVGCLVQRCAAAYALAAVKASPLVAACIWRFHASLIIASPAAAAVGLAPWRLLVLTTLALTPRFLRDAGSGWWRIFKTARMSRILK